MSDPVLLERIVDELQVCEVAVTDLRASLDSIRQDTSVIARGLKDIIQRLTATVRPEDAR